MPTSSRVLYYLQPSVGATLTVARGRGRAPPLRTTKKPTVPLAKNRVIAKPVRTLAVAIRSPRPLCRGITDETVVQLGRKKPDTYIDITVDMDELDLTSSEAKATYDEIKDYIFDKHCIKVSSLYVAQVKQKHGIIERDCYNNPKKDNPKQPQCPPEKVKLIEEALRHFKMIP